QVNQVAAGQGVAGSQQAAGLGSGNGGSTSRGGGAAISQIGPVTPNLDPVLLEGMAYSHKSAPQENTVQSQTSNLIDVRHIYSSTLQQGLITGGVATLSENEQYLRENAPTDVLNPSVAPVLQLSVQHALAQGFGVGVNSRFIRVARNNYRASEYTFRSQLLNVVANVLNLYW